MKSLSRVRLFATPWTVTYQAPLSMGFYRQEYWSGVPLPSLKDMDLGEHYSTLYSISRVVPRSVLKCDDAALAALRLLVEGGGLGPVLAPVLRAVRTQAGGDVQRLTRADNVADSS